MCAYKTLFNKLREALKNVLMFNLNIIKPLTQVNKCGGGKWIWTEKMIETQNMEDRQSLLEMGWGEYKNQNKI